ncbi:lectin C-type domain protein, partial [Oesophagostomum dentatum]
MKEAMQTEQQERIAVLQNRFENELKISEAKSERKLSELKRKHDSEVRKLTERKSWYEAEEECLAWGGHLASVLDEKENSFIRGILRAASAWIGINDVQAENAFVNTDLAPVDYRNFKD